jgi:hypothetical protein
MLTVASANCLLRVCNMNVVLFSSALCRRKEHKTCYKTAAIECDTMLATCSTVSAFTKQTVNSLLLSWTHANASHSHNAVISDACVTGFAGQRSLHELELGSQQCGLLPVEQASMHTSDTYTRGCVVSDLM